MSRLPVKTLFATFLGVIVIATAMSAMSTPALALGGCGPNMHRGANGACYWGGQNQAWCLRHTGHKAVRMRNGKLVCFR